MKTIKHILVAFVLLLAAQITNAQSDYYFPKSGSFDSSIPSPEQFLGYPIGSHYTRHDQIVAYLNELAKKSNKIHVEVIGKTYELRPQVVATITSADNYRRIDDIQKIHATLVDPSKPVIGKNEPVIVDLSYSVHGNETSSAETSLLTAYYLVANQSEETAKFLKEAVILIDPSENPDGRDRAANWYNSYKSYPPVADGLDKEHQEQWPGGRGNHYLNNLNRDWLNLSQIESVNRVEFFHKWYPNIQIDFHEQGSNATYYFEPSPKRHQNPHIPQFLYDFNVVLAKYEAKALDAIGSLYFTKENYDNLSPIYGSTYPKFYGSVGATFEEASSGGILRETTNGLLTFSFTIRNHLATSLATICGAVAEKEGLFKVQKEFFKNALEQGRQSNTKAYVFGDSRDENLTQKFLGILLRHRVKVYELNDNFSQNGKTFQKKKAYVVPSEQPNYQIVNAVFEENILQDSLFMDNTAWSLIQAYGLQYAKVNSTVTKGGLVTSVRLPQGEIKGGASNYAYLLSWTDYNASKALYYLLDKKVLVKTAFKPFTVATPDGNKTYSYGSLVIPVAGQTISSDSLYRTLKIAADSARVSFTSVSTGFNIDGIDLGSSNIKTVSKPEVAVAFGQGINSEEAGQVWFLLNKQLSLPVVKIDVNSFQRALLNKYNTIVLPGGNYAAWDKSLVDKLKNWVNAGGTLVTFQSATAWAINQGLINEKLAESSFSGRRGATVSPAEVKTEATKGKVQETNGQRTFGINQQEETGKRLDYVTQQDVEGASRINGAIFEADIDITHPIGFGLSDRKLYINKNDNTVLVPSANRYATVAQYTSHPFVNGYAPKESISKVKNSAAIIVRGSGAGSIVLFADDPTYRNYWPGTNRLFINALFFANLSEHGFYGAAE
ncbi:MAG: M14 family zinc carboxypeptidase [Bacteroidota bacterium]|nr:M14 family zinc carboxypeptidase [Bacteroidota bacterium]